MAKFGESIQIGQAEQLYQAKRYSEAEAMCRSILRKKPRDLEALDLLGRTLMVVTRDEESFECFDRCASIRPREVRYQTLAANALITLGRYKEAIARFQKALKLRRDDSFAIAGLASAAEKIGDHQLVEKTLQPFCNGAAVDQCIASIVGRHLTRQGNPEAAIEIMEATLRESSVNDEYMEELQYALGAAYERIDNYDKAFEAYSAANAVFPEPFNEEAHIAKMDTLIDFFSPELMQSLPRANNDSSVPIFVAGMPRSGTTLVDRIIDAHPQAFGAGELTWLQKRIDTLGLDIGSTRMYPQCVDDMDHSDIDTLADDYLSYVGDISSGADRVLDKYLGSYCYIGLLEALFPKGRIIYCKRNPLDSCMSCFAQRFQRGSNLYVTDLKALGTAYRSYERLMAHWQRVCSLPILTVQYEELVADQEGISQQIIDFCELPWDETCLHYHKTGRIARTLSYEQVRKPVYKSSLGRGKRFGKHIQPLIDALESTRA